MSDGNRIYDGPGLGEEEHNWDQPESCPYCPNQGWYTNRVTGEPEQCEWCVTNPDSIFNQQ